MNASLSQPFKDSIDLLKTVLGEGELEVTDENNHSPQLIISKNPIDLSAKTSIIKSNNTTDDTVEDGAPEGNDNAKGPHKRSKFSKKDQNRYKKRIVGKKTSEGVEVKMFSEPHVFDRIAQRNISMKKIEDMLASDKVSPDKTYPDTRKCYDIEGMRLVLDVTDGTVVTVEKRRQNK